MTDGNVAIPLAALIISVTTLVLGLLGLRQKAGSDALDHLDLRVRELEVLLRECETTRAALQRQNVELLRRLARLPDGGMP